MDVYTFKTLWSTDSDKFPGLCLLPSNKKNFVRGKRENSNILITESTCQTFHFHCNKKFQNKGDYKDLPHHLRGVAVSVNCVMFSATDAHPQKKGNWLEAGTLEMINSIY